MAPIACDHANVLDPVLATPPYAKSGFAFIYTGEKGIVAAPGCASPGFNGYLAAAVPLNSLTGV